MRLKYRNKYLSTLSYKQTHIKIGLLVLPLVVKLSVLLWLTTLLLLILKIKRKIYTQSKYKVKNWEAKFIKKSIIMGSGNK